MKSVRINKKQRKKRRRLAADYIAKAEAVETSNSDRASRLRRIASSYALQGSPTRSRKKREARGKRPSPL